MPSVAMKLETESTSSGQTPKDPSNPVKQIEIFLEKRVRNLEKRKQKLCTLADEQRRGKSLEKDQLEAIGHLPEVEYQVEFAKDFMKCIYQITQEAGKCAKQLKKAEQRERNLLEQRKLKDFMKIQDLLNCFGTDETRQHFIDGTDGAMKLDETKLAQLDALYNLLAPNRETITVAGGSWSAALEEASTHAHALVSAISKPIPDMEGDVSYKDMHALLLTVADSGYFEPSRACSPNVEDNQESGSSSVSGDDHGLDSTSSRVAKSGGDNSHQSSAEPTSGLQGIDVGAAEMHIHNSEMAASQLAPEMNTGGEAASSAGIGGVVLNGTNGSGVADPSMLPVEGRIARISTSSGGVLPGDRTIIQPGIHDEREVMALQQQQSQQSVPGGFAGIQVAPTGADMSLGASGAGIGASAPLPQRHQQRAGPGAGQEQQQGGGGSANLPISEMFLQDEQHELAGSAQPGLDASAASSVPFYPIHFSSNIQQNQFGSSTTGSFGVPPAGPGMTSHIVPDQSHSFQSAQQSSAIYGHDAPMVGINPVAAGQGVDNSGSVSITMPLSPQDTAAGTHHQPSGSSAMIEEPSQYQQHQQLHQQNQIPAQRGWGAINQPQQPAVDPSQPIGTLDPTGTGCANNRPAGANGGMDPNVGFNNAGGFYQQERGGYRGGNRGGGGSGYRGNGGYFRGRGGPRGGGGSGFGGNGGGGGRGGRGGGEGGGYYGNRGSGASGPPRGAPRGGGSGAPRGAGFQSRGRGGGGGGNWRGASGAPAQ